MKKLLYAIVYGVGFFYGIFGLLYGLLIANILATILNCSISGKLILWELPSQLKVLILYAVPSYFFAFGLSYVSSHWDVSIPVVNMVINGILFSAAYGLYNWLLKTDGFKFVLNALKGFINKMNKPRNV
ncbi:MAG: hypothetical protein JKY48_07995 [Flavobacteriales bacterium]|nr:hypothetical protein [Flavobacteriales bacterium]